AAAGSFSRQARCVGRLGSRVAGLGTSQTQVQPSSKYRDDDCDDHDHHDYSRGDAYGSLPEPEGGIGTITGIAPLRWSSHPVLVIIETVHPGGAYPALRKRLPGPFRLASSTRDRESNRPPARTLTLGSLPSHTRRCDDPPRS